MTRTSLILFCLLTTTTVFSRRVAMVNKTAIEINKELELEKKRIPAQEVEKGSNWTTEKPEDFVFVMGVKHSGYFQAEKFGQYLGSNKKESMIVHANFLEDKNINYKDKFDNVRNQLIKDFEIFKGPK